MHSTFHSCRKEKRKGLRKNRMNPADAKTVDEYIHACPDSVRPLLEQVRKAILAAAPEAEEGISYKMPAYKLKGKPLVYFAAFPNHIGFYPIPTGISKFQKELSVYKQGKGSVQFPLDKPVPLDLIRRIVLFRVKENLARKLGK